MPSAIYLDHHAATPIDARVVAAMERVRREPLGNPASPHSFGRRARAHLEEARARVAAAIGARASEVILTSGGTEACNLGVLGLAAPTGRIVTTAIEHPAVLESAAALAARGREVHTLAILAGRAPEEGVVASAIRAAPCALLAAQSVNHETGTILPVASWARIAADAGAPVFVDATQALGKIGIDWDTTAATAMALASHKIGGPAGAGALVLRRGVVIDPQVRGGAQERGLRAGTPDVIAMVGFGEACTLLAERLAAQERIAVLRDRIEAALIARGARRNGEGDRVATVTDVSLTGWRSSTLVAALDLEGLAVASGAACSSGVDRPSPVVLAMFPDEPQRASSAIRVSLGPETSDDDAARAIAIFDRVLSRRPA
jgi:cysteine desulfurase